MAKKSVVDKEGEDLTGGAFRSNLSKIASASSASSRAAIEAAKATKPSLHTRFVL